MDAGDVATRTVEARDEAKANGIRTYREDDRHRLLASFAASAEATSPVAAIATTPLATSSAASPGNAW